MIPAGEARQFLAYVRRTGVHEELETRLRAGRGGRPRALRVDVLLTALMLTYLHRNSVKTTLVLRTLTRDLARPLQVELGIRSSPTGTPVTLRQVRYLWNAISDLFIDQPEPTRTQAQASSEEREEALQSLIDRLTGEASRNLPPTGVFAVDATAIESAARGKRVLTAGPEEEDERQKLVTPKGSFDREARWGYRTKTYDNKSSLMFGYQLIGFTRCAELDADPGPLLMDRIRVVAGNETGISETIEATDALEAAGRRIHELLVDRGFSYKKPENWANLLHERGISQVLDLNEQDRGPRRHDHGYLMIDGWAHCPQTPEHLWKIPRPARFSVEKPTGDDTPESRAERRQLRRDIDEFNKKIEERRQYAFERHAGTRDGRSERFVCPARAGKIVCSGCPMSQFLPEDDGNPLPEVTAEGPLPKACRQETISIGRSVNPKLHQQHYWGSIIWQRSYARRNRVESGFSLLKTHDRGCIKRGWTRQVGRVKTTLLLAIAVAATNLNQLIDWCLKTGYEHEPLAKTDTTDHGFVELDKDGNLADKWAPPRSRVPT